MKPSEILSSIVGLEQEARDSEAKIAALKITILGLEERIEAIGYTKEDVRTLLDSGATWEKIEERLLDLQCGITPDAISEPVVPSGPRLRKDGQPAAKPGRKPRPKDPAETEEQAARGREQRLLKEALKDGPLTRAGLLSAGFSAAVLDREIASGTFIVEFKRRRIGDAEPVDLIGTPTQAAQGRLLTDEIRAKLNATLERGPLQIREIQAYSWAAGLDVEALMAEDPSAFVRWELGPDSNGNRLPVWGTWASFLLAASRCPPSVPAIKDALVCSEWAARKVLAELNGVNAS